MIVEKVDQIINAIEASNSKPLFIQLYVPDAIKFDTELFLMAHAAIVQLVSPRISSYRGIDVYRSLNDAQSKVWFTREGYLFYTALQTGGQ